MAWIPGGPDVSAAGTVPVSCLLVFNAGSSSVAFALLPAAGIPSRRPSGAVGMAPSKRHWRRRCALAHELGPKRIRANAISAGAVATRAASGIEHFDELLNETVRKAPLHPTVDSCEVGRAALLLASDYPASPAKWCTSTPDSTSKA